MRILVLYPGLHEERCQLLAPHKWRLRLSRVQLVLADDLVHSDDASTFADVLQLPSSEQADEVWQVIARYLERHPVDGIVAQSEAGLLIGARIAREFGLPGPTVDAVMATVNKFKTRTLLQAANIPQPAFALARSASVFLRRNPRICQSPLVMVEAATRSRARALVPGLEANPRHVAASNCAHEGASSGRGRAVLLSGLTFKRPLARRGPINFQRKSCNQ